MDARIAALAASLCLFVAIVGCVPPTGSLTAHPTTVDTPPVIEPGQVEGSDEAGDVQTVGDMEPVKRWIAQIERLDDLGSRVTRDRTTPEFSSAADADHEQEPAAVGPLSEVYAPDAPDDPPGSSNDRAKPASNPPDLDTEPDPARVAGTAEEPESPGLDSPSASPESLASPVLGRVSARAATFAPAGAPLSDDRPPSVNDAARAGDALLTLEQFTEQWLAQPADTSFRAQLDRRLLLVLAGRYEDARRPLELVSDEQQRMAGEFVEALLAIRAGHGGDPAGEANHALERVEALAEALVPLSDLRIPIIVLARAVRGYGRYDTFDPPHFLAGRESEFVVYCEVGNFVSRPAEAGGYESRFSMRTAVLSRAGEAVLEIADDHIADECRTRRRDCFIPRLVCLPATLSPGEYVVKVTIIDKIAGKVAERRTTFRIVAR